MHFARAARCFVEQPDRLLDINKLPPTQIEDLPDGGLRIGALVTNASCAYDNRVAARYAPPDAMTGTPTASLTAAVSSMS